MQRSRCLRCPSRPVLRASPDLHRQAPTRTPAGRASGRIHRGVWPSTTQPRRIRNDLQIVGDVFNAEEELRLVSTRRRVFSSGTWPSSTILPSANEMRIAPSETSMTAGVSTAALLAPPLPPLPMAAEQYNAKRNDQCNHDTCDRAKPAFLILVFHDTSSCWCCCSAKSGQPKKPRRSLPECRRNRPLRNSPVHAMQQIRSPPGLSTCSSGLLST